MIPVLKTGSTEQRREMLSWSVQLNVAIVLLLWIAMIALHAVGIIGGLVQVRYVYLFFLLKSLAVGLFWWTNRRQKGYMPALLINMLIDILGISWAIVVFEPMTKSLIAAYLFYVMSTTLFWGPTLGVLASVLCSSCYAAGGLAIYYKYLPRVIVGSTRFSDDTLTVMQVVTDSTLIFVFTISSALVASYFLVRFYRAEEGALESSIALDQTQKRFNEAFDNIEIGVFRIDNSGKYVSYNQAYPDIYGYTYKEMRTKGLKDLVHEDELFVSQRTMRSLFKGDPPLKPFVRKCLKKDGTVIFVETAIKAVEEEGMGILFYDCTARDVTQHEVLLRELKSSQHYLNRVFQSITDALVTADKGRNIISTNESAQKAFGYDAEEFKVIGLDDLFTEPGKAKEIVAEAGIESAFIKEVELKKKDGTTFPAELTLSAIRDPSLAIAGYVVVARDISEAKAEAAQRRQLRMKLIQSDKLATIGQLSAGVAHELNNPLTGISFSAQVLLDKIGRGISTVADKDKVERILEGTDRIQELVKNLLTFARAPKDEDTEVEEIKVAELVDESLVLTDYEIEHISASTEKNIPDGIPSIKASKNKLKQVLINLFTNACHAMAESPEKKLKIRASHDDGKVLIEVEDTGVGIPEEDISKIFEAFFTTKEVGKGTGLGLAVSSNIISEMGGSLDVESEVGVGTTFKISLPLEPPASEESKDQVK